MARISNHWNNLPRNVLDSPSHSLQDKHGHYFKTNKTPLAQSQYLFVARINEIPKQVMQNARLGDCSGPFWP